MPSESENIDTNNDAFEQQEKPEIESIEQQEKPKLEAIDASGCAYVFSRQNLIYTLFLAAFVVLSHWNVWSIGQYAAGWNHSVLWIALVALIGYRNNSIKIAQDWFWLAPICLIAISFSLYENPWLNKFSLFVLPISIGLFYAYSHVEQKEKIFWDFKFLGCLCKKIVSPVINISPTTRQGRDMFKGSIHPQRRDLAISVAKGFGLLIPFGLVAFFILESVDQNFGVVIYEITHDILDILGWTFGVKMLWILILTIVLLATVFSWRIKTTFDSAPDTALINSVISGIVMVGVLFLYIVFIVLQVEYLLTGSLPLDFSEAKYFVKYGFWQLFILSAFNTLLFIVLYQRTTLPTQLILRVYIFASGLILLSGCWRIALYAYWYGLSYEKFFAGYTSIFSMYVFVYLLIVGFMSTKKNILKFIIFSSLWFYAVATVMPIEKIIFNTNTYLQEKENSRIDLNELRALSVDVYGNVVSEISAGKFDSERWRRWAHSIETKRCTRKWYESNLSILTNCP